MEKMNALTLIITLVVGVILTGALLGPVISDATKTEQTYVNEGYYYMQKIDASEDSEIVVEYTKTPFGITYNGNAIDLSGLDNAKRYTFAAAGTDWVIRFTSEGWVGMQGIGTNFNFGSNDVDSVEFTFTSGTVTAKVTVGETTTTYSTTYETLWIYSPTPTDWVMKKSEATAYLHADSEFFNNGVTQISVWNEVIKVEGTVDSWDATIVYPSGITTTLTNKNSDVTIMNGYVDLYSFSKVTFTIDDGSSTVDATYSYFIVPAEVTAELTNHLTPGQISLMGAIPVMVIVALLMAAVGAIALRRAD